MFPSTERHSTSPNEMIDRKQLAHPTYLYVSHPHQDHFEPQFLHEWVSKEATVIGQLVCTDVMRQSLVRRAGRQVVWTIETATSIAGRNEIEDVTRSGT